MIIQTAYDKLHMFRPFSIASEAIATEWFLLRRVSFNFRLMNVSPSPSECQPIAAETDEHRTIPAREDHRQSMPGRHQPKRSTAGKTYSRGFELSRIVPF